MQERLLLQVEPWHCALVEEKCTAPKALNHSAGESFISFSGRAMGRAASTMGRLRWK